MRQEVCHVQQSRTADGTTPENKPHKYGEITRHESIRGGLAVATSDILALRYALTRKEPTSSGLRGCLAVRSPKKMILSTGQYRQTSLKICYLSTFRQTFATDMTNLNLGDTITVFRSRAAAASCLKRTMKLSKSIRKVLTQYLICFPKRWEYSDRVFCWLHPEYRDKIEDFYNSDGPPLRKILCPEEIDALDVECASTLGNRLPRRIGGVSDIKLLCELYRVKNNMGRTPTLTELGRYGKYSQRLWNKRFGSYMNFLDALGLQPPKHNRSTQSPRHIQPSCDSREILINTYKEIRSRLGRSPQITEFPIWDPEQFNSAVEGFGGWKKFLDHMREIQDA